MGDRSLINAPVAAIVTPSSAAERDERIIALWLNGLSPHTQRAYGRDSRAFLAFVGRDLATTTLEDVQRFAGHLNALPLQPGSRHRVLAGVKSLFAFAARLRYIPFDTTAPMRLPACKDTLNERILEEHQVVALIAAAVTVRDRVIIKLLYHAALRVGELVGLKWRDFSPRRGAGQLTIFGKGGKTRVVLLSAQICVELEALRRSTDLQLPIFVSRRGGHLDESQVLRLIKAAAKRAGLPAGVSPHWLRHCHASHALDHGAPVHLVQTTLGHSSVATTSRYLHARPSESSSSFLPS